jgi:hypothetical protein
MISSIPPLGRAGKKAASALRDCISYWKAKMSRAATPVYRAARIHLFLLLPQFCHGLLEETVRALNGEMCSILEHGIAWKQQKSDPDFPLGM